MMASFSWDLPTKAKDSLWEADSSRPTNAFGTNFGCFVVNAKKKQKKVNQIKFNARETTIVSKTQGKPKS